MNMRRNVFLTGLSYAELYLYNQELTPLEKLEHKSNLSVTILIVMESDTAVNNRYLIVAKIKNLYI